MTFGVGGIGKSVPNALASLSIRNEGARKDLEKELRDTAFLRKGEDGPWGKPRASSLVLEWLSFAAGRSKWQSAVNLQVGSVGRDDVYLVHLP